MTFLSIFFLTMPDATTKMVGLLTLAGQLAGFIFEVPSGYVSDRIGHRNALLIARIAMVLSTACYIFADNTAWFFAGSILLAIGLAFVSGTGSALMHNTLTAIKRETEYAKIMGRIKSLGFGVPVIFILLLPVLAESSFQIAFIVALVIDIIGLLAVIAMAEPDSKKYEVEEVKPETFLQNAKEMKKLGWLPYVIITQLIFALSFGATAGFKNPFQESLGFSISMLGVLWAASRVFISALLLTNGWVYKTFTYKQYITLHSTVYALSFMGILFTNNMWIVASLFLIGNVFGWGLTAASDQYTLEFIGKSKSKATLISISQLIQKIFAAGTGLLMGILVFNLGYNKAYFVIGLLILLTVFTAIVLLPRFHPQEPKTA